MKRRIDMGKYDYLNNIKPVVTEVYQAIEDLKKEGKKITNQSIGERIGKSKQSVHSILASINHPTNFQPCADIVEKFKDIETKDYTAMQLKELIEYKPSVYKFQCLLNYHKISYKRLRDDLRKALNTIDTTAFTYRELAERINYDSEPEKLRKFMVRHEIPFKPLDRSRKKNKIEPSDETSTM